MKKLTSAIATALLLSVSAISYAESPVNSTSTKQVAKEQLSNSGHIIDDCRVTQGMSSAEKAHCLDQQQLKAQNSKDQQIMQKTGQDDRVKHQDINKGMKHKGDANTAAKHHDSLMKSDGERDRISEPASNN